MLILLNVSGVSFHGGEIMTVGNNKLERDFEHNREKDTSGMSSFDNNIVI